MSKDGIMRAKFALGSLVKIGNWSGPVEVDSIRFVRGFDEPQYELIDGADENQRRFAPESWLSQVGPPSTVKVEVSVEDARLMATNDFIFDQIDREKLTVAARSALRAEGLE